MFLKEGIIEEMRRGIRKSQGRNSEKVRCGRRIKQNGEHILLFLQPSAKTPDPYLTLIFIAVAPYP
jgi:hypothetical protein